MNRIIFSLLFKAIREFSEEAGKIDRNICQEEGEVYSKRGLHMIQDQVEIRVKQEKEQNSKWCLSNSTC